VDRIGFWVFAVASVIVLSTPAAAQQAAAGPAAAPEASAGSAAAQEPAEEPGAASDAAAKPEPTREIHEEIVVTAAKREQTLQEVSIPVAVVSGDDLEINQIGSLEDLQFLMPNMTFGNDLNFAKPYIRGLGLNSSFHGVDPEVALHVDGAVVAQSSAYFASLFDLERIEVLRGPQSTLYGRNNTGGTINVITRPPSGHRGGFLNGTVGGDDLNLVLEGAFDQPLSDRVLSRLSFRLQRRDGYGINETSGNEIDDAEQSGGRAQLLFLPSENVDFRVVGEYYREDDHAYAFKFLAPSFENAPPAFRALGPPGVASDPRNIRSQPGFDPTNFKETYYGTATANWTVSDKAIFRSITNYRELTTILGHDFSMSDTFIHRPLPLLPGQTSAIHDLELREEQYSQEFQLLHDHERFQSIFGVYYLHEDVRGDNTIGDDPFGKPQRLARVILDGDLEVDAYAAFANFTIPVSDRVSLRVAGRYSYEDRHLANEFRAATPFAPTNLPNAAPPSPNSEAMPFDIIDESWSDFSPEVGIDWQASEKVRLYATYAEGFKSGNAEIGANNPTFVDPEAVTNVELGMKSAGLADNTLQLNLAAFYYELEDGQFNITIPIPAPPFFITALRNAAKQEGQGIEMDALWRATDRFRVELGATYLDAEFTEFFALNPIDPRVPFTPDPTTLPDSDLSGNKPRNSPEWQGNLSAVYNYPVSGGATWTLGGNLAYKDSQFFNEFNDPRIAADAYTLVDAFARYATAGGRWSVEGWVKNIGDELVLAGAFPVSTSRTIGGTYLPPRRYGLTLGYSF
jgi:iron complex outermembrane receptor protein